MVTRAQALKLNRALYGLKEAPKVWNDTFNKFAIENKFKRSEYDSCLYCKKDVWLVVYVDDILVTGKTEEVKKLIKALYKAFQAKGLGEVKEFLGMSLERTPTELRISQRKMIEKVLKNFKMEQCKGISTPMEVGFQLQEDEQEILQVVPYRELIGSLMYLCTTTRADLMYSVSYLSRVLDRPTTQAWKAGKRVLRYLQQTKEMGLTYKRINSVKLKLNAYADANWATDKLDRKSISGSVIFFQGNAINWFSRKQNCIALSTAEAEYIAAAATAQDLINLKGIINEFNLTAEATLLCDNQSAILMSKTQENLKRSKHIDIKFHFLKHLVQTKKIEIKYICSEENVADMFTKPLGKEKFHKFRKEISGSD